MKGAPRTRVPVLHERDDQHLSGIFGGSYSNVGGGPEARRRGAGAGRVEMINISAAFSVVLIRNSLVGLIPLRGFDFVEACAKIDGCRVPAGN